MGFTFNSITLLAIRLCTALRFLTLLPIAWRANEDHQHFPGSLIFFPVVGVGIGILGALMVVLLNIFLPQPVVVAMSLTYLAFISGCLHLDGLSDSADGLLSSRPREDCLRIMKDSRAGAMGIVVVVLVLLTKYAALSSLPSNLLPLAIFLIPLTGRCAILLSMGSLPYAREEGGLGQLFYSGNSRKSAASGLLVLVVLILAFRSESLLPVLAGFLLINFFFNRWCRTKLGGATGDTLGAVCELTEMVTAVALTVSFSFFL
jgi:adenosylcobinamide-GDP ribazoletransferase